MLITFGTKSIYKKKCTLKCTLDKSHNKLFFLIVQVCQALVCMKSSGKRYLMETAVGWTSWYRHSEVRGLFAIVVSNIDYNWIYIFLQNLANIYRLSICVSTTELSSAEYVKAAFKKINLKNSPLRFTFFENPESTSFPGSQGAGRWETLGTRLTQNLVISKLFCRGRLRNVPNRITHVQSHSTAH